uniref:Homeobox domain-containing protein n=1 Tax=Meloidogyne hapla TaxID=6305 RepID=A0A1I8BZX6_MELHA
MKGEENNGTIFTEHSPQSTSNITNGQTAQMFPQLPSTSHTYAPFSLWENQQWQNCCQQYNTPMTPINNSFQHSPRSTINIFAGYPNPFPSTFNYFNQQQNIPNLYDNNQTRIDPGTSSSIYQQTPLTSMDAINLQIESNGRQFNPLLFPTPKVCVSVNSYNLEDTKTRAKNTLNNSLNNNLNNKLISSSTPQHPTRQIFGPGTNNLRVRTKDQYRIVYNEFQRIELEKAFVNHIYVTSEVKAELSSRLHLTERRAKERKQTKQLENIKKKHQQNTQHLNNPHNLNYTFPLQNHPHQQQNLNKTNILTKPFQTLF